MSFSVLNYFFSTEPKIVTILYDIKSNDLVPSQSSSEAGGNKSYHYPIVQFLKYNMQKGWGDESDSSEEDEQVIISAAALQKVAVSSSTPAEQASNNKREAAAEAPPVTILQRPATTTTTKLGGRDDRNQDGRGRSFTGRGGGSDYRYHDHEPYGGRYDHHGARGRAGRGGRRGGGGSIGGGGGGRVSRGGRGHNELNDWKTAAKASSILNQNIEVDGASWMAQRRAKQQEHEKAEREAHAKQIEEEKLERERRRSSQLQALKEAMQSIQKEKEKEVPLTSLQAAAINAESKSPLSSRKTWNVEKILTRQKEHEEEDVSVDASHGSQSSWRSGRGRGRDSDSWARVPRSHAVAEGGSGRGPSFATARDTHIVETATGKVEYRLDREQSFTKTKAERLPSGGIVISRVGSKKSIQSHDVDGSEKNIQEKSDKAKQDDNKQQKFFSSLAKAAASSKDDDESSHAGSSYSSPARHGRRSSGRGRGRHSEDIRNKDRNSQRGRRSIGRNISDEEEGGWKSVNRELNGTDDYDEGTSSSRDGRGRRRPSTSSEVGNTSSRRENRDGRGRRGGDNDSRGWRDSGRRTEGRGRGRRGAGRDRDVKDDGRRRGRHDTGQNRQARG